MDKPGARAHPARWVPTLYFAEGLPFYAVSLMALIFYQRMGLRNDVIAFTTSLLGLPWSLKPLWSPFLEMYRTKKFFVVLTETAGGLSLGMVALCLPLPSYFRFSLALFALAAFCSSTHDIAADGIYIGSLSAKEQAAYAGWQGGFYNVARFFAQGGLIILAGYLEDRMPVIRAWMAIFGVLGLLLVGLALYHARVLPKGGKERHAQAVGRTFWDVVSSFFRKPNILFFLVFIFLYRAGEGQVVKIGPLFLKAARSTGGLGLTTAQFGAIYGTFGTGAFILGSILGGYFTSWLGLRRALLPLVAVMNLPMLAYFYLSTALPTNTVLITLAMSMEMFGYGFGFVGVILLMMQEIAPGKYQTAHYAFANSLMNLGLIVPGAISGKIQMAIGYRNFFIWVLISAVPALLLARIVPIHKGAAPEVEMEPEHV
ncbi:putative signal transducer [Candidatus Sulfopaludibacter sp. SbA4]|nr:putative signal transducer [Candidatus Sulfopaludibacter sp. SbA4]